MIKVGTDIPKAKVFRFEIFWFEMAGFIETIELHWNSRAFYNNSAKTLLEKFKQTRRALRAWSKELSPVSWVIAMMDSLEDQRRLSLIESNCKKILKKHYFSYWRIKEFIGDKEPLSNMSNLGMKIQNSFKQWLPQGTGQILSPS